MASPSQLTEQQKERLLDFKKELIELCHRHKMYIQANAWGEGYILDLSEARPRHVDGNFEKEFESEIMNMRKNG